MPSPDQTARVQVKAMQLEGVAMDDLALLRGPDDDLARPFRKVGKKVFLPEIAEQRYKAHETARNECIRLVLERRLEFVKHDRERAEERQRIRRRAIDAMREERRRAALEADEWYDSDDSDELAAMIKKRPTLEEEKEEAYRKMLEGDAKYDARRLQIAKDKIERHAEERRVIDLAQAEQHMEKVVYEEELAEKEVERQEFLVAHRHEMDQKRLADMKAKEEEAKREQIKAGEVAVKHEREAERVEVLRKEREAVMQARKKVFASEHARKLARLKEEHAAEEAQANTKANAAERQREVKERRRQRRFAKAQAEKLERERKKRKAQKERVQVLVKAERVRQEEVRDETERKLAEAEEAKAKADAETAKVRSQQQAEEFAARNAMRKAKAQAAADLQAKRQAEHAAKREAAAIREAELLVQQKKEQAILRDQLHLKKEKKQAHVRRQQRQYEHLRDLARQKKEVKENQVKEMKSKQSARQEKRRQAAQDFVVAEQLLRREEEKQAEAARYNAAHSYLDLGSKRGGSRASRASSAASNASSSSRSPRTRRAAAQKESAVRLACAALPALNEDGTSVPSAVSQDHRELFARAQRYALAQSCPRGAPQCRVSCVVCVHRWVSMSDDEVVKRLRAKHEAEARGADARRRRRQVSSWHDSEAQNQTDTQISSLPSQPTAPALAAQSAKLPPMERFSGGEVAPSELASAMASMFPPIGS